MIKPIGKNVVIKPFKEESKHSLLLPNESPPKFYIVVEIGDEVTKILIGNKIVITPYNTHPIVIDDEMFFITQEDKILAKII